MTMWRIMSLPEVVNDVRKLDKEQERRVQKAIRRVAQNPLPASQGGYGKPLGNKGGSALAGLQKIKMRGEGLRVVYKAVEQDGVMLIVVVGVRADDDVYKEAAKRKEKYGL